jgi:hypothetical protein
MAQSFHANSNTRLHPSEWTSGVAAGGTAVMMARHGWTTREALSHVGQVRAFLNSSAVGQPLQWTGLPPANPPVSRVCALGRCLSVDARGAKMGGRGRVHNLSSVGCDAACATLGEDEWLADLSDWLPWAGHTFRASVATSLKKSTAPADMLPPDQLRSVGMGSLCQPVVTETFESHLLCVPELNFSSGKKFTPF